MSWQSNEPPGCIECGVDDVCLSWRYDLDGALVGPWCADCMPTELIEHKELGERVRARVRQALDEAERCERRAMGYLRALILAVNAWRGYRWGDGDHEGESSDVFVRETVRRWLLQAGADAVEFLVSGEEGENG